VIYEKAQLRDGARTETIGKCHSHVLMTILVDVLCISGTAAIMKTEDRDQMSFACAYTFAASLSVSVISFRRTTSIRPKLLSAPP
jgi:hypothetical protein